MARSAGLDDVFAHGMLSMAYLARLLTDLVPQEKIRSYKVRFTAITPVHGQPTCTGTVTAIDEVNGERLATLDPAVALADGTITLIGDAASPSTEPRTTSKGRTHMGNSTARPPSSAAPDAASAGRSH